MAIRPVTYQVYALRDPFTNEIRYVGATRFGFGPRSHKRLTGHMSEARKFRKEGEALDTPHTERLKWILSVLDRKAKPIFEVLEEFRFEAKDDGRNERGATVRSVPVPAEVAASERYHIDRLVREGVPLLNVQLPGKRPKIPNRNPRLLSDVYAICNDGGSK